MAARLADFVQTSVRALWLYVLPALVAGLALEFLVPLAGSGFAGWVARTGHDDSLYVVAALFLFFSALARHWRFHLPGGRHASALPFRWVPGERDPERLRSWAELATAHRELAAPGTRRRLARALSPDALGPFDGFLGAAERAIACGELEPAMAAVRSAAEIAAPVQMASAWTRGAGVVVAVAVAAGLALVLREKVVGSYQVLSASMLPTLEPADRIGANKVAYRSAVGGLRGIPARGDVILFRTAAVGVGDVPGLPDVLVKRVVGLPGDRIEMNGESPVINGWDVPSCDAGMYLYVVPDGEGATLQGRVRVEFLGNSAYLTLRILGRPMMRDAYVVAPGEVFVLGDNRANSLDSRSWNDAHGGGVPLAAIVGRADWFLAGTHRSGETDLTRLMRPINRIQAQLRMEGVDATALENAIARCLADRPKDTWPPPPGTSARTASAGAP